jgi:hypothetical protein
LDGKRREKCKEKVFTTWPMTTRKEVALPTLTTEYQQVTSRLPYTGGYTDDYTDYRWVKTKSSARWDFCEEALQGNEEALQLREEPLHEN